MLKRKFRRSLARASGTAFIPRSHDWNSVKGYSRARHIAQLMETAIQLPGTEAIAAIANIPDYVSRGHGKSQQFIRQVAGRTRNRSKYQPHAGLKQRGQIGVVLGTLTLQ